MPIMQDPPAGGWRGRARAAGARVGIGLSGLVNWQPQGVWSGATGAEPEPVVTLGAPAVLSRGEPFTVLSWNLQFAGTRRYHFFYDGGPEVSVRPEHVREALDGIGAVLAEHAPTLALLQEIDRDSARTGRVDELVALLERAPFPTYAATPYHRSRFVPVPPRHPLGRIDLALGILSRVRLEHARRHALAPLVEPWLRQEFNLKRAILSAEVPVAGAGPLAVAVTHLSAFSRGDGTLPRQVEALAAWMRARRQAGQPFVLGGDLNCLPPGDDPARLGAEATEYADDIPPITALLPEFRSLIPVERLREPTFASYLPPGASVPDRVLDYVFVSDDIEILDAAVLPMHPLLSDHLPLWGRLRLAA